MSDARIWQSAEVSRGFLEGTRAAIPLAQQQLDVMLRLLQSARPVTRFLDLGCGDGVLAAAVLSQYPTAHAVCLDFSPEMTAAARRRLPNAQVLDVDYSESGWTASIQQHAPFDAIVSGFSVVGQFAFSSRATISSMPQT